jgi:hypothetical protein
MVEGLHGLDLKWHCEDKDWIAMETRSTSMRVVLPRPKTLLKSSSLAPGSEYLPASAPNTPKATPR